MRSGIEWREGFWDYAIDSSLRQSRKFVLTMRRAVVLPCSSIIWLRTPLFDSFVMRDVDAAQGADCECTADSLKYVQHGIADPLTRSSPTNILQISTSFTRAYYSTWIFFQGRLLARRRHIDIIISFAVTLYTILPSRQV